MAAPAAPAVPAAPAAPTAAPAAVDFGTLSAEAQRASLRTDNIQAINKVYYQGDAMLCSAVHGPTKTEVVGVPFTPDIASSFALHLSVLRGHVSAGERAILRGMEDSTGTN